MQSKFKGEICGGFGSELQVVFLEPCFFRPHIFIEGHQDPVISIEEVLAGGDGIELGALNLVQERNRVMACLFPKKFIYLRKKILSFWFPNPPQIESQFPQALNTGWKAEMV
jgi:hypothetical protein